MENHEIIRSMIQAENELINHRLTWMSALNGLLFAGLGFAWGRPETKALVYVFSWLGIAVSLLSGTALVAANHALRRQYDWWKENKPLDYSGPDVIGLPPLFKGLGRWLATWTLLPFAFLVGWIAILLIN